MVPSLATFPIASNETRRPASRRQILLDILGSTLARRIAPQAPFRRFIRPGESRVPLGGALDARIMEIGAGLGRTAFYVRQFGIRDITIIDLPLSAVAQAYFLGRTLGPDAMSLFGEHRSRHSYPAADRVSRRYGPIRSCDQRRRLPRCHLRQHGEYCQAIKSRADAFLSINHEANSFTVGEITASAGMWAANRAPYWLRRGYVEEVFFMRKTISSG